MYFLIVGFVMWIGTRYPHLFNSAFSPVTTWGPIAVFISISLLSEGLADKKRHVSDFKTNTFRCIVVENATADVKNRRAFATADETAHNAIPWDDVDVSVPSGNTTASFHPIRRKDIRQGHIVVVRNREMIPADIILLASSGDRGCAYIETSSIDGETNLKLRSSAKHKTDPNFNQAQESIKEAVQRIAGFTTIGYPEQQSPASGIDHIAELTTEPPNAHINTFSGLLKLPGLTTVNEEEPNNATTHRELPLGADNLLLRGAVLRNTEWAIGIAGFTGTDTKLSQNAIEAPSKFSQLDLITNKCVIVMIVIELICIIYLSTCAVIINKRNIKELWCVKTRSYD